MESSLYNRFRNMRVNIFLFTFFVVVSTMGAYKSFYNDDLVSGSLAVGKSSIAASGYKLDVNGSAVVVGTLSVSHLSISTMSLSGKNIKAANIDSSTATSGHALIADGAGNASFSAVTPSFTTISINSAYTALSTDNTIIVTADATITLPAASGVSGKTYHIFASGSGTDVTIDPNASETVCGQASIYLLGNKDSVIIQSDGSNWRGLSSTCFRTTSARVTYSAGTPSISNQVPDHWGASMTDDGVGITTFNFTTTTVPFSAAPNCTCSTQENAVSGSSCMVTSTTTAVASFRMRDLGATLSDENIFITCYGPR